MKRLPNKKNICMRKEVCDNNIFFNQKQKARTSCIRFFFTFASQKENKKKGASHVTYSFSFASSYILSISGILQAASVSGVCTCEREDGILLYSGDGD